MWRKVAILGVGGPAPASVPQTGSTARAVSVAMGGDKLVEPNAVGRAPRVLRDCFARDALDAGY